MLKAQWTNIWQEEELFAQQVGMVTTFMNCNKPARVETAIEFARYLQEIGLTSDNYPLFLEFLRESNHHVIDALFGEEKAFDFFTKVQVNRYIIDFCFRMLSEHIPGGIYERTLELIFGVLYRNYHSAKEGYTLYPLTVENLNAIGKYLEKNKPQSDSLNRFILNILVDISGFISINSEDENIDRISAHAVAIRNAFFDRTVGMDTVIPPELLTRQNYRDTDVNPRTVKSYSEQG